MELGTVACISMVTARDDLITLATMLVTLSCSVLCVFSSQDECFLKWGQTSQERDKQGPLASLLAAPLVYVLGAILCTMNAFPFSIKIDQHD